MADHRVPGTAGPSVTREQLEGEIADERFYVDGTLTFAVLTLKNGFKVTGESACAAPENFDKAKGEHYAREAAINKMWALEGYRLRSHLATLGGSRDAFGGRGSTQPVMKQVGQPTGATGVDVGDGVSYSDRTPAQRALDD